MPSSPHPLVVAAAARTLDQMARALGELLAGLTQGLDLVSLHRIHDGIGQALVGSMNYETTPLGGTITEPPTRKPAEDGEQGDHSELGWGADLTAKSMGW